jgi:hypothetical protein
MKSTILIGVLISFAVSASAQDAFIRGTLAQGFNDFGAIKIEAERGDVAAQVKLAEAYLANFKSADALKWYEAAAKQNSVEGQYQLGNLLLFGRVGIPQEQSVSAKPAEGLKWTQLSATHGNRWGWHNMARALQNGTGCSTNLVEAYAWLALLSDSGDIQGRVEMNNLALKLSTDEIIQGKSLSEKMKLGDWPELKISNRNLPSISLGLRGISGPENHRLAIINNSTLTEGETAPIKVKKQSINVTCLKITEDAVQIIVEGEDEPRILRMK